MLSAIAQDFAALDDVKVHILWNAHLPPPPCPAATVHKVACPDRELVQFHSLAGRCDATLVIAPEIDNILLKRCQMVEEAGGRLLGPGVEFVRITSDKFRTSTLLRRANVSVPEQLVLTSDTDIGHLAYPVVVKSRTGAGSNGVFRIDSPHQIDGRFSRDGTWCVERYQPGRAASVAILCGQNGCIPLAPCWQHLGDDGTFAYQGGSTIMERRLAERCVRLARAAVLALPPSNGYVGVDIVLGAPDDGLDDVVIELNPRLTTSYVGLRAMTGDNLAQTMLDVCRGKVVPPRFDRFFRMAP
jgi:predicted ATP-grasp superfamily ATP-dependent carboligase